MVYLVSQITSAQATFRVGFMTFAPFVICRDTQKTTQHKDGRDCCTTCAKSVCNADGECTCCEYSYLGYQQFDGTRRVTLFHSGSSVEQGNRLWQQPHFEVVGPFEDRKWYLGY